MNHCHCSICRKVHGTPFATYVSASVDDYRLLSGSKLIQQFESSPGFNRPFCTICGSVVPMIRNERRMAIAAGSLDDDPGVRPTSHIFVASKASWYQITDDLPKNSAYPDGSEKAVAVGPNRSNEALGHLHGSCLCGEVAYVVSEPFRIVHNCHCSRCRKSRAAAHATNGFASVDGFSFKKGEELLVPYKVPEAKFYTPVFCKICGSNMPRVRQQTGSAIVPLGSLDSDQSRSADDHIFVGSKAPWYEITDGLPQYLEMPPT